MPECAEFGIVSMTLKPSMSESAFEICLGKEGTQDQLVPCGIHQLLVLPMAKERDAYKLFILNIN